MPGWMVVMLPVTALSEAYQGALVLTGHGVARRMAAFPGARRVVTRIAGLALIGLGIRLAMDIG